MAETSVTHPPWKTFELRHNTDEKNHITVIALRGKDLRLPGVIKEMDDELDRMLEQIYTTRLIVDFSHVEMASSAVFGLVVEKVIRAREMGITVRICAMTPTLRRAFELISGKENVRTFDNLAIATSTPWDKDKKGWWPF